MSVYNSATISSVNRIGLVDYDLSSGADSCFDQNFCISSYQTLEFTSASDDIKAVRLTGTAPPPGGANRFAFFDTLTYGDRGDDGGGGNGVPEPSSLALVALAGLAAARIRWKARV